MDIEFLERSPRIQPELPIAEHEIPTPPQDESGAQPLWQSVVPLVTIVGYLLVSGANPGANVAFLIPMALAVFISTGIAIYNTVRNFRMRRRRAKEYLERLMQMRRDMEMAHEQQRQYYEYTFPALKDVQAIDGAAINGRGGTRLWERRVSDADFGAVRIGIGTRPSTVQYTLQQKGDDAVPELLREAERLEQDSRLLDNAPVTIQLYRYGAKNNTDEKSKEEAPPRSAIAVSGDPRDVYAWIRTVLVHFTAFHSPVDSQVYVLGTRKSAPEWAWAYNLRHCIADPSIYQTRLYFEDAEMICAPEAGRIEEVYVQPKQLIAPGKEIAALRNAKNQLVKILCPIESAGLVQMVAVEPKMMVEQNALIIRVDTFELSKQQLDEEKEAGLEKNGTLRKAVTTGKARKRETAGIPRFWKERIWRELDRRERRLRDSESMAAELSIPLVVTVVDMLAAKPDQDSDPIKDSWLDDLETEAATSLIIGQGARLGSAVIYLVPHRKKAPSGCQAVIELKRTPNGSFTFLYAETGLNTPRMVGQADEILHLAPVNELVKKWLRWDVRRSYGMSVMDRSIMFLRLFEQDNISDLHVEQRWLDSRKPEKAEWCKIPIAKMNNNETRDIQFWSEKDGNHAMIAGSTGSGKSELLTTLILALAVRYDPSIVNFVLIDFKGGTAFEPFKDRLPHVVDVVTNLSGNAVGRMFAAINAELERRETLNNHYDVKDIVSYRVNGWHLKEPQNTYPHLFIIIDEFAEMIANNPEYKAQLDSIARKGRSLGVSLILAAQRPSGVTDQMRANIKMKICLRVETKEESAELLRSPDAAFLPSIPGRGYLQIGSESLELIQTGFSGEVYRNKPDYDPNERYLDRELIWREDLLDERDEIVSDVLIRRLRRTAAQVHNGNRPWRKPWPDALPHTLYLNSPENVEVAHFDEEDILQKDAIDESAPFVLVPAINNWLNGEWTDYPDEFNWKLRAMRAVIGIIDNPSEARLHPLEIDFRLGHHVVFGASGYGKSVFLRSTLTALMANHPPNALHVYIMDFGNRSLQVFENAPHVGDYITGSDPESPEKIERLLRMLDQEIEQRRRTLSSADDFLTYNHKQRNTKRPVLPAVLVVIDNFATIKEDFEHHLETLMSLTREGLSAGIYFLVSAEQTSAVGRLYSLLPERLALKLSDDGEYAQIVGRGARMVEEVPGRGFKRRERVPLEMQVALPVLLQDESGELDETSETNNLIQFLLRIRSGIETNSARYAGQLPKRVDVLEKYVNLADVSNDQTVTPRNGFASIVLGKNETDLLPTEISLDQRPHFIISGAPASGKSNALLTWIVSLASRYSPDHVALVLVDHQGNLGDYGSSQEKHRLDQLPHVLGRQVISEKEQLEDLIVHLEFEYRYSPKLRSSEREVFILIDNYDDIAQLDPSASGKNVLRERLGYLARRYGRKERLHFVIAGMRESFTGDELMRPVGSGHFGLAMDTDAAEGSPFYANVPRAYRNTVLPRGRGFIVLPGSTVVTQVAVPYSSENDKIKDLDAWFDHISSKYAGRFARWIEISEEDRKKMKEDEPAKFEGYVVKPNRLSPAKRNALLKALGEKLNMSMENTEAAFGSVLQDGDDSALIGVARGYEIDVDGIDGAAQ